MKYIIGIIIGGLVIGALLSVGVYCVFGERPGYFFAEFLAAPVGLVGAGLGYIVYDTVWSKKKSQAPEN